MLHSNTFRASLLVACRQARALLASFLLLVSTLLASTQALADNSPLEGDMGLTSSAPSNTLIDTKSHAAEPLPPKISPAQAASLVRTKIGGQVMSVNSRRSASGVIYGVKVLDDGRMRVINVDGQTGQLLNQ